MPTGCNCKPRSHQGGGIFNRNYAEFSAGIDMYSVEIPWLRDFAWPTQQNGTVSHIQTSLENTALHGSTLDMECV